MRLAAASVTIAATLVSLGATQMGSPSTPAPKAEATTLNSFRHVVPGTYKSWTAQLDSLKVCKPLRDQQDEMTKQWVGCLVGHYEAKTGYLLTELEYRANRKANRWVVQYSRITLPGGGERINKAAKAAIKVPSSVYCKVYTVSESGGQMIICSNGTSY